MSAKIVTVLYHFEDGLWWAASDDLPGWSAAADTFEALRDQVYGGVQEFVGGSAVVFEVGGEMSMSAMTQTSGRSGGLQLPISGAAAASPNRAVLCS